MLTELQSRDLSTRTVPGLEKADTEERAYVEVHSAAQPTSIKEISDADFLASYQRTVYDASPPTISTAQYSPFVYKPEEILDTLLVKGMKQKNSNI